MSYTNQTPNYGLPQYEADDKPTYLGDFNKAMLDIDTNMKTIDTKAISAESNASSANATAQEANSTAESAKTQVEEVQTLAQSAKSAADLAKSTADTAKSTADTAKSTADTANNTANINTNSINNLKKWTEPQSIVNPELSNSTLKCSYNNDLKFLNLHGRLNFLRDNPNNIIIGTLPEEVWPAEERTIENGLIPVYPIGSPGVAGDGAGVPADLVVNTKGQIVLYNNGVGAPTRLNYGFVQLMLNISDWKN